MGGTFLEIGKGFTNWGGRGNGTVTNTFQQKERSQTTLSSRLGEEKITGGGGKGIDTPSGEGSPGVNNQGLVRQDQRHEKKKRTSPNDQSKSGRKLLR